MWRQSQSKERQRRHPFVGGSIAVANAVSLVKLMSAHGADPDIEGGQGKPARETSYRYGAPEIADAP
jgi:hypothetical protein